MINKAVFFLIAGLTVPFAAHADWECSATCEYHSTHAQGERDGFVERVEVDLMVHGTKRTELAKYRKPIETSDKNLEGAFTGLTFRCLDTAAANTTDLLLDTEYSPKVVDSQTFEEADPQKSCVETANN